MAVGQSATTSRTTRTATSSSVFNRMKNWRGLASRYDKHALVYRGGVVLAAVLDWLT